MVFLLAAATAWTRALPLCCVLGQLMPILLWNGDRQNMFQVFVFKHSCAAYTSFEEHGLA